MPLKDPIKRREYNRAYERMHADKARERCKKYRQKNRKKCTALGKARAKKYRIAHREKTREFSRISTRKRLYGITECQYQQMFTSQRGRCAICNMPEPNKRFSLSVDHCHVSGKVRELLCSRCNPGLGMFRDSPDLLLAAIKYLQRHATRLNDQINVDNDKNVSIMPS